MTTTSTTPARTRHPEQLRALARLAYATFEPYHLVAYFGPHVDAAREEMGIGWLGSYTGMRAAPLGAVPGPVVAATFFGFKAPAVTKAWGLALDRHTPGELDGIRTACVDAGLREALGALVDSPDLAPLVERLSVVVGRADFGGRPLSAAYAARPLSDAPHLALWDLATLWREWRGDGHNAALTAAALSPIEALVLYDAWVTETAPKSSAGRGRRFLQPTRKWTDEEWAAGAGSLASAGLVSVTGTGEQQVIALTPQGLALREQIETATDDAAAGIWEGVDGAEDLVKAFRQFSKPVIDTGWLPGTRAKG